ncbi:MAG: lipopolysaccharide biosynthesis protein, partial [Methanobacteriota archaeon]
SRRRLRHMFLFSMGKWIASVVGCGAVLLLPILIVNTLGAAEVANAAFFYAAATIAGLLYIIPNATMTSFLAEASQQNAQRRRDERKAILLSLALLAPGIVGMSIVGGPLLALFNDPGYVASGTQPLRILSLGSIPVFLNGVFGTRVRIRKQTWPLIAAATLETAVTLGLGYFLLVRVGLEGLAYAFVAGQAAATPLLWLTAGAPVEAEPVEPTPVPP